MHGRTALRDHDDNKLVRVAFASVPCTAISMDLEEVFFNELKNNAAEGMPSTRVAENAVL